MSNSQLDIIKPKKMEYDSAVENDNPYNLQNRNTSSLPMLSAIKQPRNRAASLNNG